MINTAICWAALVFVKTITHAQIVLSEESFLHCTFVCIAPNTELDTWFLLQYAIVGWHCLMQATLVTMFSFISVTRWAGNVYKDLGSRHDSGVVQRRAFGAPVVGVAERRST